MLYIMFIFIDILIFVCFIWGEAFIVLVKLITI